MGLLFFVMPWLALRSAERIRRICGFFHHAGFSSLLWRTFTVTPVLRDKKQTGRPDRDVLPLAVKPVGTDPRRCMIAII